MNAQDYVNSLEYPVFFYAGNGSPAGQQIPIWEETELPIDLEKLEGEVVGDTFEATNLTHGPGAHDWSFSDWQGNIIYKVQIYNDEKYWLHERAEWEADV